MKTEMAGTMPIGMVRLINSLIVNVFFNLINAFL